MPTSLDRPILTYRVTHPTLGAGSAETAPTITIGGRDVLVCRFDHSPDQERVMLLSSVVLVKASKQPSKQVKKKRGPRKKTGSEPQSADPENDLTEGEDRQDTDALSSDPAPAILPQWDAVETPEENSQVIEPW